MSESIAPSMPEVALARSAAVEECVGASTETSVIDVLDMHCAACAVLIEDGLRPLAGVTQVRVHYATQRARVAFDPALLSTTKLLAHIERLGYTANVADSLDRKAIVRAQRRRHIWGFGLSAFCAMQVMMVTVPRFIAGADMEPEFAPLLDWAAFALVLPVIAWSARPFYRGAMREFKLRRLGMDSAIVLGIVTAFAGSMWHLLAATGVLYFDSVAMFVALLLGVRWLEWEQRERNYEVIQSTNTHEQDAVATRITLVDGFDRAEEVNVSRLNIGDRLWVRTGEAIPVDGALESDTALCDESLLTGESSAVLHVRGEVLVAGAINSGAMLTMRTTATAESSTSRRLTMLADDAVKPGALALADVVARYFMPAMLLVAGATFFAMLPQGVNIAAERAIAVLIISCPCALALAAPAAYARAFAGLLNRGLVLRRAVALERLAKADAFLLDKTGTLSTPSVIAVEMLRPEVREYDALSIVGALEGAANHPLAAALRQGNFSTAQPRNACDLEWTPGAGVSGVIDGTRYRFGRADFVGSRAEGARDDALLWLADERGLVCSLRMGETPREDAQALVDALKRRGSVEILSGDDPTKAAHMASRLNIAHSLGGHTPEQKAIRVQQLQREGRVTVMIGDGVNDAISLAGADVSIAVRGATDAARARADLVCISDRLQAISEGIGYARRVVSVVRLNFAWAIAYNLVAIPFAVAGIVNPLIASVGMAASSAVVMLNVMRLGSVDRARLKH
ncbi:MAG: cation-translocating P-type ATPase [Casimicrobium sp.]